MKINAPSYITPFELGVPERIPINNPGAGAEWTITIGLGQVLLVTAIGYRLAADANVATRESTITLSIGGTARIQGIPFTTQGAGLTRDYFYTWSPHSQNAFLTLPGTIPNLMYLKPGWILTSSTTGIQVGDLYTNIYLMVHRWLTQLPP